MILRSTKLEVCDHSGARQLKCIGFLKSIFASAIGINEVIRVCVTKFNRNRFFTQHLITKKGKAAVMARVVSKEIAKYDRHKGKKKTHTVLDKDVLLYYAIVVSTSKKWGRRDGTYVRTLKNRAVVLDNSYKLRSSRVVGPVSKELRSFRKRTIFFGSLFSNAQRRI